MIVQTLASKPFMLATGSHGHDFTGQACFNELAALLAGEPFTDSPACVSPIVRQLGMPGGATDELSRSGEPGQNRQLLQ